MGKAKNLDWNESRIAELRRVADDYRVGLQAIAQHFGVSDSSICAAMHRYTPDLVERRRRQRQMVANRKSSAKRKLLGDNDGVVLAPFAQLSPRVQAWFMERLAEGKQENP
jgi:hypothetical protein